MEKDALSLRMNDLKMSQENIKREVLEQDVIMKKLTALLWKLEKESLLKKEIDCNR